MNRNDALILIIDDDEEFCEEIAEALTEEGYAAGYACDRNAVDKKISTENFALVLLDIKMKEESGIDVLKRVKQKQPQVKVFIVSGKPHVEYLLGSEGVDKMVDRVFQKPFCVKELLKEISDLLAAA